MTTMQLVKFSAAVLPLPFAFECHETACGILRMACEQAVMAGKLDKELAYNMQRFARRSHTGAVRALCELALTSLGV